MIDAVDLQRSVVEAFLEAVLVDGRVAVAEIEAKARAASLLGAHQRVTHSKPFKRAKTILGIESVRDGFGADGNWFWTLPRRGPPVAASLRHLSVALAEQSAAAAVVTNADTRPRTDPDRRLVLADELREARANPDFDDPVLLRWTDAVGRLNRQRAPKDVPVHRWRLFMDDCDRFLGGPENWGARASRFGWNAMDLFGYRRDGGLAFPSSLGLLWRISGGRLLKLQRDWALFEDAGRAAEHAFHRRVINAPDVTLPWRSG
jgi:hypothetical protein